MAAALIALAAFVVPGAQPARAATTTVWSATLTVGQTSVGPLGCAAGAPCSSGLTNDSVTYDSAEYRLTEIRLEAGTLTIRANKAFPTDLRSALTLHVGSAQFALADSSDSAAFLVWSNTGLNWSVGGTVSLSLTAPSKTPTDNPTTSDEPQVFPALDRLPVDPSLKRPASQRRPEAGRAADAYCYIGEGNGATEYVRYPDGRIVETIRQSDAIRSMFAC